MSTNAQPLTGGLAIWIFMLVEVATFSMFLLAFATAWQGQEAVFLQSQSMLHVGSGTFGTAVLLLGSWAAYEGVLAAERGAGGSGFWFAATAASGIVFSVNKIHEYSGLTGVNLSTNDFWFSYLFLTALHLLHVVVGIGAFGWLAWIAFKGKGQTGLFQTGAAYWHLVDVIWLLLFPILYLMHP